MTLRVEEGSDGQSRILHLSGRIDAGRLMVLQGQIGGDRHGLTLDLEEVTLVDLEAVRFLGVCEAEGVRPVRCPPYVREWTSRELGIAGSLRQGSQLQQLL